MIIFQIIAFMFCVIMTYHTLIYFRKKEFDLISFLIWESVWVLIMFSVVFPNKLIPVVQMLKFNRAIDLLLVFGFLFIMAITFFNYKLTIKNNKMIKEIIRDNAIKK